MWQESVPKARGETVDQAREMSDEGGIGEDKEDPPAQSEVNATKFRIKEPPSLGFSQKGIRDQIKLAFDSCAGLLNPNNREKCFEIFGFDFMIDEDYRIWLIECNSVPSLSESNPFLTKFFNRLLGRLS